MTRIRFGRSGATSPPSQPGDTGLPCEFEFTPLRDSSAERRRNFRVASAPNLHSSGETPAKAQFGNPCRSDSKAEPHRSPVLARSKRALGLSFCAAPNSPGRASGKRPELRHGPACLSVTRFVRFRVQVLTPWSAWVPRSLKVKSEFRDKIHDGLRKRELRVAVRSRRHELRVFRFDHRDPHRICSVHPLRDGAVPDSRASVTST